MAINKALLKYNYENFDFYILEFCDTSKIHEREKFYIDQIINGYNILKIPGNPSRISG
jgi:group I intron endonuclease